MQLAIWLPVIYKLLDLASVNFAKSNFFREIWRISLITISLLKDFEKFTGKHLCQSLFLGLQIYVKKRDWYRCFTVNFAKFLRTPFFIEHLWWLLLKEVAIFNFGHRDERDLPGVSKPAVIFYRAMKTFVRLLPGY